MSDALNKLIEAVEAGRRGAGLNTTAVFGDNQTAMDAVDAFDGSLDAAKALHEALLPEWLVENIGHHSFCDQWWCSLHRPVEGDEDTGAITRHSVTVSAFNQDIAARAWLLAILRAYAAQQEPTP